MRTLATPSSPLASTPMSQKSLLPLSNTLLTSLSPSAAEGGTTRRMRTSHRLVQLRPSAGTAREELTSEFRKVAECILEIDEDFSVVMPLCWVAASSPHVLPVGDDLREAGRLERDPQLEAKEAVLLQEGGQKGQGREEGSRTVAQGDDGEQQEELGGGGQHGGSM